MVTTVHLIYFFFFGFFFLATPEAVGAVCTVATGVDDLAMVSVGDVCFSSTDFGCSWRRFCIFWIKERFKASNRLRKIEENVLNLIHWKSKKYGWMECRVYWSSTHCGIISNFEHEFPFSWLPFHDVTSLANSDQRIKTHMRIRTDLVRRVCVQGLRGILEFLPGVDVDHRASVVGWHAWRHHTCHVLMSFHPIVSRLE